MRRILFLLVGLGMVGGFACSSEREDPSASLSPTDPTEGVQGVALEPQPGLEQLYRLGEGIISGGQPVGDAGFASLAKLGVLTIISVDGQAPDIQRARSQGLRYVHLPIGYDGVPHDQALALTRAVRDLPGKVYIHCHHGTHRGPAAAAVAALGLGLMDHEQANAYLKSVGTSPKYGGLYESVAQMKVCRVGELDALEGSFPEVATVSDLASAMADLDRASDFLKAIANNGWAVPEDHPDLVPLHVAERVHLRLQDAMRASATDATDDFKVMMSISTLRAETLVKLLADQPGATEKLKVAYAQLRESCTQCHSAYRQ